MLDRLIGALGDEVRDPEEEAFITFSQPIPSHGLGMVDPKRTVLDITVAGRDFVIYQSPTVLSSNQKEGTTGAVLWKVTPLLAEWLSQQNIFKEYEVLGPNSSVIELGSGVSGMVTSCLASSVRAYVATDQVYALKLLKQNIAENTPSSVPARSNGNRRTRERPARAETDDLPSNVSVVPLDWEMDAVSSLQRVLKGPSQSPAELPNVGFDVVIACDCIYNEALIEPFVSTCVDICELRQIGGAAAEPTVCIIAQQLRSPDVFESWLTSFHARFRTWRLPDAFVTKELGENSGFVVHIGLLRG
ncbi:hypothetical protein M501DRAFT_1008639 [Patellaria atrata CBS 101060]|uniref:Diaminohydroxyphosphoribosylamino-pyrimidine deaminase n=1 Tax=Patellaria atrata CBS 101060 TaxID=1346257 RepID=A0A9P4S306_9PEZI|nr:hypothetical protein M501DRAFT_1008639 [Patellaria atrata CBS 101060]